MAHSNPAPNNGTYATTKSAFASFLQHLSSEIPTSKIQMVSIHPGAVFTPGTRKIGLTENSLKWDNEELCGAFSVWVSTKAAAFLHGRFVWANWDVEELLERKDEINREGMLKMGLQGSSFFDAYGSMQVP
jgi:NAD(P)-dependent dehydrogenase (short-subunit alcohol dehydrogenase family)